MADTWSQVNLLNISVAGLAFASDENLPAGALRRFRFYLPDNQEMINLIIKIGYSRNHSFRTGFRIGATFLNIKEAGLVLISQFIDDHAPIDSQALMSSRAAS